MLSRLSFLIALLFLAAGFYRCGQPLPPMGGKRDSLPPVLVKATPADSGVNVSANRIVLEFNEYIQLQNIQQHLIVSPVPEIQPQIEGRLKTVTIKLKDSLRPNTTYSFGFGDALEDINESNALRNFTFVFSTGPAIDTGKLSGRVLLAETGKADSTILVILQPDLTDTAVRTKKPRYFTRINKDGFFTFRYLSPGNYNVFALKDADGGLKYDQPSEAFGFLEQPVTITGNTEPVKLYAFSRDAEKPRRASVLPPKVPANKDDRRLRYSINTEGGSHDFQDSLKLRFDRLPVKFDSSKIYLASDTGIRLPAAFTLDSNILHVEHRWTPGTKYKIYIEKDLAQDSLGFTVIKNDTLKFSTRKEEDYGSLSIRLLELDTTLNPVLLFYANDILKKSVPLRFSRLNFKYIMPDDYELKILFDKNNNGKWDTGDYDKKIQPELIKPREQKLNIRANWDNEVDINLKEVKNQG
jgi:uncharacterized protein (DUF2141 family)